MEEKTLNALRWIVGILNKHQVPYRIGGGFAAHIYGSNRPINDIDISLPGKYFSAIVPLGGIFLISLLALFPSGVLPVACVSILFSIVGSWALLNHDHRYPSHVHQPSDYWYIFLTVTVYVLLAGTSIWILLTDATPYSLDVFCGLIVILFGLSLIRAWRALLITKHHPST